MEIFSAGSRPTIRAPKTYFTGEVWQDPIITAPEPARLQALRVAFVAGARTYWHMHPLGQTLYVVRGQGLVGLRSAAPQVISEGDTVWIPPDVEHWHGAGPETSMVHIAMQEADNAISAVWLEEVSDRDYLRATS
jgi:quercetin dioxygenase-like cupin family protein